MDNLGQLNKLSSLGLGSNQLSTLEGLEQFSILKLEWLYVDRNPITSPPIEQLKLKNGNINILGIHSFL